MCHKAMKKDIAMLALHWIQPKIPELEKTRTLKSGWERIHEVLAIRGTHRRRSPEFKSRIKLDRAG